MINKTNNNIVSFSKKERSFSLNNSSNTSLPKLIYCVNQHYHYLTGYNNTIWQNWRINLSDDILILDCSINWLCQLYLLQIYSILNFTFVFAWAKFLPSPYLIFRMKYHITGLPLPNVPFKEKKTHFFLSRSILIALGQLVIIFVKKKN